MAWKTYVVAQVSRCETAADGTAMFIRVVSTSDSIVTAFKKAWAMIQEHAKEGRTRQVGVFERSSTEPEIWYGISGTRGNYSVYRDSVGEHVVHRSMFIREEIGTDGSVEIERRATSPV